MIYKKCRHQLLSSPHKRSNNKRIILLNCSIKYSWNFMSFNS